MSKEKLTRTPNIEYNYRGELGRGDSILPNSLRSEMVRGLLTHVPGIDMYDHETFLRGDDTEIANDYTITAATTGTAKISTNPGHLTMVTAATNNDTIAFQSNYKDMLRAGMPRFETKVTLAALTSEQVSFGFYDDSDEYALIRYDTAVGSNWLLVINDGSGADTIDTGIAATTAETRLVIESETDGTVHVFIGDYEVDVSKTSAGAVVNKMVADAHYRYINVKALAAAAKTVTFRGLKTTIKE